MAKAFEGKVALVTGATSGIGKASALAFAREGAKVVVAGRRETEGAQTVSEIEALGGEALFVKTDVSKEADNIALVAKTIERFGRLDFAFNNAGIYVDVGPITTFTDEIYNNTMDINVRGVAYGLKHQIPAMLKTGGGVIINNASALGIKPMPGAPIYNASKFAVIGLTKSAALEFAAQGIRINAVCPAVTVTDIVKGTLESSEEIRQMMLAKHPVGRFGTVDEIASSVIYLCTPGAAFITGVALPVDGGWTT